jgi:hypothetical protein
VEVAAFVARRHAGSHTHCSIHSMQRTFEPGPWHGVSHSGCSGTPSMPTKATALRSASAASTAATSRPAASARRWVVETTRPWHTRKCALPRHPCVAVAVVTIAAALRAASKRRSMPSSVWPDDGVGVVATLWIAVADMVSEWPRVMLQQSMHPAGRVRVRCDPLKTMSGNRGTRETCSAKNIHAES